MSIVTLLIILLIVALFAGVFGYGRYGALTLSPAGIILLVILILWLTGNLRIH